MTFMCWYNRQGNPGQDRGRLIHKANGSTSDDWAISHATGSDGDPHRIFFRTRTTTEVRDARPATQIDSSGWHFIAGTWNPTTGDKALWIDGTKTVLTTHPGTPNNASGAVGIGGHVGSSTRRINGYLDEVAIFASILSDAQIDEIRELGIGA
jgi:hypothetical protein